MQRTFEFGAGLPRVCRLGLATRGNTRLEPADVQYAIDRGVNYLNWCGHADGLSEAIAQLGKRRREVVVAYQLQHTIGSAAQQELAAALEELNTDYLDVVTFYYVESRSEWDGIAGPGGAIDCMRDAQRAGTVRLIGLTSHQRKLAVEIALGSGSDADRASPKPGTLDLLMLRYNAAHRGAEEDVFPATNLHRLPVVVYTCVRWGGLMQPTPDDPQGFVPPAAPEWYRFALANPSVAVALMAPNGRSELEDDLALLDDWRAPTEAEYAELAAHGARVREHAGYFP